MSEFCCGLLRRTRGKAPAVQQPHVRSPSQQTSKRPKQDVRVRVVHVCFLPSLIGSNKVQCCSNVAASTNPLTPELPGDPMSARRPSQRTTSATVLVERTSWVSSGGLAATGCFPQCVAFLQRLAKSQENVTCGFILRRRGHLMPAFSPLQSDRESYLLWLSILEPAGDPNCLRLRLEIESTIPQPSEMTSMTTTGATEPLDMAI